MAEIIVARALDDTRLLYGLLEGLPQNGFIDMVAAFLAGLCILPPFLLREHPLPPPVLRRVRILAVQGVWQPGAALDASG